MLIDNELDHVLLTLQVIQRRVECGLELTNGQAQKVLDIKERVLLLRKADVVTTHEKGQLNLDIAEKWRLSGARVCQLLKDTPK